MKKSFVCMSILLALALVLTMFVGCLGAEEKGKAVDAKTKQEWKWYKSKEGGFKFRYPACFELEEIKEEEGYFSWVFRYEWKTNDRVNRASLLVTKSNTNKSIYEIVNMSKETLLFMENAKMSEITLDRKPAVMLITDEKRVFKYGGSELYNLQVIVECKHEGWVYGIDFGSLSPEPVPDSWYKEVISSFEFL